ASGKSAIGSELARRLGFRFYDTGAMYRAMTWLALERGIDANDEVGLARLAMETRIQVSEATGESPERTRVVVDDLDATPHLRDAAVDPSVSFVSRVPAVRTALVRIQRRLAAR